MRHNLSGVLFSICLLGFGFLSNASHLGGGEVSYQHISGDSFRITVNLYRDCDGIMLDSTAEVIVEEVGCNQRSVILLLDTVYEITPICYFWDTKCNSSTSNYPGYELWRYSRIVSIPCGHFRISYEQCCRNGVIHSIGPGPYPFVAYADNYNPAGSGLGPNSSPIFTYPPVVLFPIDRNVIFNFSAIDLDGDSLVYSLGRPEGPMGDTIPYNPDFHPLSSPVQLDSITGIASTKVDLMQVGVIRINVDEYRKTGSGWVQIGTTFRDVQVVFYNIFNFMPQISGINGTHFDTWYATAGDSISFFIGTQDSSTFDTTDLTVLAIPPGSNFSNWQTVPNDTATFTWQTDSTHLRSRPYVLVMKSTDSRCPYSATTFKAIKIFVTSPDTAEVWPGDANNDLIANHYDILPIGVGFGTNGPQRPNATTNWVGQTGPSWPQAFTGGLNYKFADCNGDGTIDTADVDVVNQNFGLTHNRYNPYARQPASADLWIEIDQDTLQPGDQVTAELLFGDAQNELTAYGVAFSLIIDPGVIDASSLDMQFQPNWLAPGGLEFQTQDGNGNLHAALVRTNGQNAHGGGSIAELTFTIRPDANITPGTQLPLSFADVLAIDASEASLNITSGVDEAVLDKSTGIVRPTFALEITPNPADAQIRISGLVDWDAIEVFNKLGQRVPVAFEHTGNHVFLNTTGLKPGFYIISVQSGDVVKSTSVLIQR